MVAEEAEPISELQPYQLLELTGRLAARKTGLRSTQVWLLEDIGGGLRANPSLAPTRDPRRIRLDFTGPRIGLKPGQRVRVSGVALPLSDVSLRLLNPKMEKLETRGESQVVLFRSWACVECGRPGTWILDWMGLRGSGIQYFNKGGKDPRRCDACGGSGFHRFGVPGWIALPRWGAAAGLSAALLLGILIGR